MSESEEQTADVVIDTIDYTPNLYNGFTSKEMLIFFGIAYAVTVTPLLVLSACLFGSVAYGFVVNIILAGGLTHFGSIKVDKLKKDRPSHMVWIDLKRRLQDKGVFGIKIRTGLIPDAIWDNTKSNSKKQVKHGVK